MIARGLSVVNLKSTNMPGSSSDTASLYLDDMLQFCSAGRRGCAYSLVLFTMRLRDKRKKWSSLISCATEETLTPSTVTWPFESKAKPASKSLGERGGNESGVRGWAES